MNYRTAIIPIVATISICQLAAADLKAFEFREVLDDAAYQKAVSLLPKDRIDPEKVEHSPFPTWGVIVATVDDGTQASQQGLQMGSIIYKLNGEEYFYRDLGIVANESGQRVVSVVAPDGKRQEFSFKPGRIGFTSMNGYRPEQYMLQNLTRGSWDADMLVACVAWQNGYQDLSETALFRAVKKGMKPSTFTKSFGMLMAYDQGKAEQSKQLLNSLLEELPKDPQLIPRFYLPFLRTQALAFQDFDLFGSCMHEFAGVKRRFQESTIKSWKAWAKAGPHPSILSHTEEGGNLMPLIKTERVAWSTGYGGFDADSIRNGSFQGGAPLGRYVFNAFASSQPVKNAIWEIHVAYQDAAPFRAGVLFEGFTLLKFNLIDKDGKTESAKQVPTYEDYRVVARIQLDHEFTGDRVVQLMGGPSFGEAVSVHHRIPFVETGVKMGDNLTPKENFFKIQLVRFNDEVEILLDDHSIFHIPIDPNVGELAFSYQGIGTGLNIKDMTLKPLIAKDGK
ncbi:hypothetical protein JIN85_07955 [Luteolibacter pohnpeiensis]|uniref:PDZ domain-containing protein n=1 Tax=Luteolibacter pohnpeiensis TaxID=454153 RepID=A0A934S6Z5_9BACT|nr:hypothetical protein [Luteolibacter pohnpeiensis]MBK1882344.1 hypothetical protein [Luteolibacter pohnpeiensis]